MKRYVLFVGGGGARAAEALLVAASAGVLRADLLQVLLADVDNHGLRSADMLRAKYADYDRMQVALSRTEAAGELTPFHTMLNFASWPAQLPGGGSTLEDWTAQNEADALLCRALFTQQEAKMNLRGGFRGERRVGQTVFAGLLQAAREDESDVLNRMVSDMNEALAAGDEVRVVLCGSVTGGTGAAGLPLLARYLREMTAGRARIGAVLLAATGEYEDPRRAREAIADFTAETACSAVCLLGLPRSSAVAAPADYAHLTDWLAVYGMDILLHRPQWPEGLFTVQTDGGVLSWDIFGKAAGRYRLAYGRLMKTAAAWNHVIGPQVEKRLRHPFFLRDNLFGWYARFFRKAGWQRNECLDDVARLTHLMRVVLIWMGGLMQALPPEMTHWTSMAPALRETQEHYAALTDLVGQLSLLDDEVVREEAFDEGRVYRHGLEEADDAEQTLQAADDVRGEIEKRRSAQRRLQERIGGAATIRLLQQAHEEARTRCEELQERYLEANRRIDHAESIAAPEDMYRITDARTRLERMERHQRLLDAREAFIAGEVAAAEQDEARFAKPAVSGAGMGNGLFEPRLTLRLMQQDKRIRAAEVEKAYPGFVQPADGRTLKTTLKRVGKATVCETAPVMSLLRAMMLEAMEEV